MKLVLQCGMALAAFVATATVSAHDTWIQPNIALARPGDAVYVDLNLGNHGNGHRDFKLSGKIDLTKCTLGLRDPAGKLVDLIPSVVDRGYAVREGYWQAKFVPRTAGDYRIEHTVDTLHGTTHAIKSGKTFVRVAGKSEAATKTQGDSAIGHALEFVLESDPHALAPGRPLSVRLLFKGRPLADAVVSFIPRGAQLTEEFDPRYEAKTDAEGRAGFTPKAGDPLLIVTHHKTDEQGENFSDTSYAATMTLFVPEQGAAE